MRAEESPPELRPRDVDWREQAPEGKLDLLTTIDFRMTSNALFSDVVLPAATWYEKYDLSSTDLHPFVHTFNQAVPPPWECKSDWDAFGRIAERFSELAETHLGVRGDVVAVPLLHDTADELAQPLGEVSDWRAGECEPVPGKTMPKLVVVERDYPAVAEKWRALGPLVEELGTAVKGANWKPVQELRELRAANGAVRGGVADGRPRLETVQHGCEAILLLSGTTNGRLTTEGFRSLERSTGVRLADLSEPRAGDRISFHDAQALQIKDNDWVEAYNRNGVVACRAAVSHRIPQGTCLMYRAKDRHLNVPLTELQGKRGGTDNSLTRIVMKPTHFIGGYPQLSFGFNYYGPTGSQRDEVTVLRKREEEVRFQ